eukprot:TRINITY_DN9566_c0_g1_i1.p1 TRINITY_DN9566_c0_g1~~TRINITY_DN9566_c0_g1_i1.p1  ORF type:complete len:220 (-),score=52.09 TRINITY_DN9566_c0_g1_i1:17-655(-)
MFNKLLAVLLTVLLLVQLGESTYGVDVSQLVSQSQFECLRGRGFNFAIPRGYQSGGRVDPNVVANIRNAKAAGMAHVDVYLFPCVKCGNPEGQVRALMDHIRGEPYGMVWLDVERYAWTSSLTTNRNFITAMANEVIRNGKAVGIYTNYYNWQEIVGLGWTGVSQHPLWYAHYDGVPNYNDFRSFGGWSKPSIKQYVGDASECGVGIDKNWY